MEVQEQIEASCWLHLVSCGGVVEDDQPQDDVVPKESCCVMIHQQRELEMDWLLGLK